MTKEEAEKAIRSGAIAALIVAALSLLVTVIAMVTNSTDETLGYFNDPWIIFDIVMVLILAFFIWRKSRVAAILMFVYYVFAKILTIVETGNFSGGIVSLIILWFLGRAIWGTFVWNRLEEIDNPDRPKMKKWWLWPIGLFAVIVVGLIGLGAASTMGGIPAIVVQTGEELPQKQEDALREAGLLSSGEFVKYYYSTGFLDVLDGGSLLTNKRIVGYWKEDGKLDSYGIDLEEIESIELEAEGSYIDDAVYNVYPYDPDQDYLIIWLSIEEQKHLEMAAAIQAQAEKNAKTRQAAE